MQKTAETDDRLLALFFLAWRGFAAEADRLLDRHGLSRMHHRVLYTALRAEHISVGELARGLGITRQALHRPLKDLLDKGLLNSRVSAQSGRERTLTVTAKGKRIEQQASNAQLQLLDGIFTKLGKDAKAGWVNVMAALAEPIAAQAPLLMAAVIDRGLKELTRG